MPSYSFFILFHSLFMQPEDILAKSFRQNTIKTNKNLCITEWDWQMLLDPVIVDGDAVMAEKGIEWLTLYDLELLT